MRCTVRRPFAAPRLVRLVGALPLFATAPALAAEPGRGLPWFAWLALLLPLVALAVGLQLTIATIVKQALIRLAPLARGEPRIAGYESSVVESVDIASRAVLLLAACAGLALWAAAAFASPAAWSLTALLLGAGLALDLLRWQRVEVGTDHVWFQRGLHRTVHQVLIENIRDVAIEQADLAGPTLRHGLRGAGTLRLKLRMKDRHVAALPKAGRASGRFGVEAVEAYVRERLASLRAEAAMRPVDPDHDLKRALRRLRRAAPQPG